MKDLLKEQGVTAFPAFDGEKPICLITVVQTASIYALGRRTADFYLREGFQKIGPRLKKHQ